MFTMIARTGMGFGVFLVLCSGALALALSRDTPEFVISVLTVGIGVVMTLLCAFALIVERKRQ